MKSVLISIRPEWIVKILNGEKTIELRKSYPKCELPCKVYIYCTKQGRPLVYGDVPCNSGFIEKYTQTYNYSKEYVDKIWGNLQGKVLAEFTLNKITKHEKNCIDVEDNLCYNFLGEDVKKAGFTFDDKNAVASINALCEFDLFVEGYGQGKPLYAWHIEDLKIYDKPKELCDFLTQGYRNYDDWLYGDYKGTQSYNDYLEGWVLRKAPPSWCYVEEY